MPEIWFPGSKDPFRPLNAHGRLIPRVKQRSRPQLWQLFVTRNGAEIPFGPRGAKELVNVLYEAVERGIRVGAETELKNPHVEKVASTHQPQGQKTLRDLIMESQNAA